MPLLFCYACVNERQLARLLKRVVSSTKAYLPDHELVSAGWSDDWKGPVTTLRFVPGENVAGMVVEVMAQELQVLDRFEGAPKGDFKRAIVFTMIKSLGSRGFTGRQAHTYISLAEPKSTSPSRAFRDATREIYRVHWPKLFEARGFPPRLVL